jgi:hypothetical protein
LAEIARRCDKNQQQGALDTTASMFAACMKPKLLESRKRGKVMSEEIVLQIKERMRVDPAFRHDLLASPWRILQAYPLTEEEKQRLVVVLATCGIRLLGEAFENTQVHR